MQDRRTKIIFLTKVGVPRRSHADKSLSAQTTKLQATGRCSLRCAVTVIGRDTRRLSRRSPARRRSGRHCWVEKQENTSGGQLRETPPKVSLDQLSKRSAQWSTLPSSCRAPALEESHSSDDGYKTRCAWHATGQRSKTRSKGSLKPRNFFSLLQSKTRAAMTGNQREPSGDTDAASQRRPGRNANSRALRDCSSGRFK